MNTDCTDERNHTHTHTHIRTHTHTHMCCVVVDMQNSYGCVTGKAYVIGTGIYGWGFCCLSETTDAKTLLYRTSESWSGTYRVKIHNGSLSAIAGLLLFGT